MLHNGFGCAVMEHLAERGSPHRSSASAGLTSSSSTAACRSCAKSTASPPRPPWRRSSAALPVRKGIRVKSAA